MRSASPAACPPVNSRSIATASLRLESRERGLLDSLRFTSFTLPVCGPDEVSIKVRAAGMNFRDVLKALALYPAETIDAHIFGDEVAGSACRAFGSHRRDAGRPRLSALRSSVSQPTRWRGPPTCGAFLPASTYEQAATLAVVFMTAWYALKTVARIKPRRNDSHPRRRGGVGMAAIQIVPPFRGRSHRLRR